jgi:hypothetical protein
MWAMIVVVAGVLVQYHAQLSFTGDLAVMHGPSFQGDGATALRALAAGYAATTAIAA